MTSGGPRALPARAERDEDDFVAAWTALPDTDGLHDVIDEALQQGRVALAARLVGLLPEEQDDPALARARRAARFVVHHRLGPEDASWSELEDAWREVRRDRMRRARLRQRAVVDGREGRIGRLDRRRRRASVGSCGLKSARR